MTLEKTEEIRNLETQIDFHNKAYWEDKDPIISDPDYDKLVRALVALDPNNELVNKINYTVTESKNLEDKIVHENPMLSLDKVYDKEDLLKWCRKVARNDNECFLVQVKYDGCSAELDHQLLSTRGNGYIGENISHVLPFLKILEGRGSIPATDFSGYLRGEIVLQDSIFETNRNLLRRKSGEPYKNSRNACAGILNTDDYVNPLNEPFLTFVPFEHLTLYKTLTQLEEFILSDYWDRFVSRVQNADYPADGLVIKLEDQTYCTQLGHTKHHRKSEIAFKFTNPSAKTVLNGVTLSCGKGCITPIGNVEPVEIGGVTVSNVNLHNMKNIIDRDIHIGDTLIVERAGDVIPYVVNVIPGKERKEIAMSTCPSCSSLLFYEEPQMVCKNPECSGSALRKLSDSVVRIGIDRLGRPTIEAMMKVLNISDLIGIFEVTESELLKLPRFGIKKAKNLRYEIDKILNNGVYEWQILAAVNISGIGNTLSEVIIEKFPIPDLIELCHSEGAIDVLRSIDRVDTERAQVLVDGVLENEAYIDALYSTLIIKKPKKRNTESTKICFSGKFPEKKKIYYQMLEDKNFEIVEKVDKTLNVLVVADPTKNSGKQKKAENLGIKIMGIDELQTTFGG